MLRYPFGIIVVTHGRGSLVSFLLSIFAHSPYQVCDESCSFILKVHTGMASRSKKWRRRRKIRRIECAPR